ncbi:hypothetical protein F5Y15DRAFT_55112 [Xylariaceae sp. FL0016]|nr:hypothetical protein F5Y15DRAFT_55112 [Xylariaceae sp. FL0016]
MSLIALKTIHILLVFGASTKATDEDQQNVLDILCGCHKAHPQKLSIVQLMLALGVPVTSNADTPVSLLWEPFQAREIDICCDINFFFKKKPDLAIKKVHRMPDRPCCRVG